MDLVPVVGAVALRHWRFVLLSALLVPWIEPFTQLYLSEDGEIYWEAEVVARPHITTT